MAASSLVTSSREQLPSSAKYELVLRLAAGGMGTVYLARIVGAAGFSRVVAIKRAHPHLVQDTSFRAAFIREAMLASRIRHPNVVAAHTVEELDGDLLLVMDYVEGASLSALARGRVVPVAIAARIAIDAYRGLHAAHELKDDDGAPLGVVHRDVSPHNLLVGRDGATRVTDFGVAKSKAGAETATGQLKGKIAYMAPEYLVEQKADRRSDVFSMGVVVWECLSGKRLFSKGTEVDTLRALVHAAIPTLGRPEVPALFEQAVRRALARDPEARFTSAEECALAIEASVGASIASYAEVSAWMEGIAGSELEERARLVESFERRLEESGRIERNSERPTESLALSIATSKRDAPISAAIPLVTAPLSPLARAPILRVPLPALAPSTPSAAMITPVARVVDAPVAAPRYRLLAKKHRPMIVAATVAVAVGVPGAWVLEKSWHPAPPEARFAAPPPRMDFETASAPVAMRPAPSASLSSLPAPSSAPTIASASVSSPSRPPSKHRPSRRPGHSASEPPKSF